MKVIGKSHIRWDAKSKVTGEAMYAADFPVRNMLYGKILRSTITHGYVKAYHIEEALKMPGVIKIILPDDLPQAKFSTAGHPYNLNPKTRDIEDRNILSRRVRQYGEDIAAVVAESELQAQAALEKIQVEYEEYPVYMTPEEALAEGAIEIHEASKNIIANTEANLGDIEQGFAESDEIFEDTYSTQIVQHCHLESQVAYAYREADDRYTIVSSTQIPHIARRILGQAFQMPLTKFRVKKPFIGGGFGNKQDVTIEPIVVAMSMACGGRPVMMQLTREESIAYTRTRHAISYKMKAGLKDGKIHALEIHALSNNGAYASHGHAIGVKGGAFIHAMYDFPHFRYGAKTVYTNSAVAGAMRGYGIPQVTFAIESFIDTICKKTNKDPIKFRLENFQKEGSFNKLNTVYQFTNKLKECVELGKERFEWDKKSEESKSFKDGDKRRGIGLACFSYGSGTFPKSFEIAGCRLSFNQDGRIKCMLGATEIGQGADTVFAQIIAEAVGVPYDYVIMDYMTDTDTAPFDTGAYASRQTYVTGLAVKKAAEQLRAKILRAVKTFHDLDADYLDIAGEDVVYKHNQQKVTSLVELALKTFYNTESAETITAETSINVHRNSYPMGVTFAYVEVDIKTGKTKILDLLNVHDSGKIINPLLASGQVDGGMFMGIGYALSEELKYYPNGEPLNNNLLDYKFPTFMDVPKLDNFFVESDDPLGPFGSKSLGEPPACSPAPAIRNAILDATDINFNHLPIAPEKVFNSLKENGII